MNRHFADDGFPLPPPLLLSGDAPSAQQLQYVHEHHNRQNSDEGFPLPPPSHAQILVQNNDTMVNDSDIQNQQQQNNVLPAWVPQQYIEKGDFSFL